MNNYYKFTVVLIIPLVHLLFNVTQYAQEPVNFLNFDGVDDFVTLGDNDGLTAVTIETWLYYQEDGLKFICSKGYEHLEIHTNTGGNLRFIPVAGVYIDATNLKFSSSLI